MACLFFICFCELDYTLSKPTPGSTELLIFGKKNRKSHYFLALLNRNNCIAQAKQFTAYHLISISVSPQNNNLFQVGCSCFYEYCNESAPPALDDMLKTRTIHLSKKAASPLMYRGIAAF